MDKRRIKELISYECNPVIFEIGANNGSDSADFCRVMPNCELHCFEPDPRAAAKWRKYVPQSIVHPDATGYATLTEAAICDKVGEVLLHLSAGKVPGGENDTYEWDKSSSIKTPTGHLHVHPWCRFDTDAWVTAISLDMYCHSNEIKNIDFVWADVQGAELEMIAGGKETFADRVHYLYTEYESNPLYEGQPNRQQIIQALKTYAVIEDFNGNVLLENMAWKKPVC